MNNKLQNVFKYLTVANFSMALYNFAINQTKNNELGNSLELERDRNQKLSVEIQNLSLKIKEGEMDTILENNKITETKIEEIRQNIDEVVNASSNVIPKLESLDNKLKSFNNDLNSIITKVEEYINSKDNFLDLDLFKEIYSYIENMSIIQNIAFMNISALIFTLFSLISILSIFFGEYLIIKFSIKEKYPKISKFIEIRRKFQRFYIIIDSLIIILMIIILLIVNLYLLINF